MVKDPVCGMEIDPKSAFATREHAGQTFYFCSKECVDQFDAHPHQFGHPKHDDQHESPSASG